MQRPGATSDTKRHMWYEVVQPGPGRDVRSGMISLGRVPAGLWVDCKTDGGGVINPAWSHFSVIFSTVFTKVCEGFRVERKFTLRMKVNTRHQNFNLNVLLEPIMLDLARISLFLLLLNLTWWVLGVLSDLIT